MANQQHRDILEQGVEAWNQWRKEHAEKRPDLSKAFLMEADLRKANLSGANLREANLREADLSEADLSGANFREANLTSARLFDTNLRDADMSHTSLKHASLSRASLRRANLSGADLSCSDLIGAYFREADLHDADLSGAYLQGADLIGADLSRANLRDADLIGADLSGARLTGACLSDANLTRAKLSGTDLGGADLSGADLTESIFVKTNLAHASLTNCAMSATAVGDVYVEGARQDNLVIRLPHQPTITVDHLEVAQFICLLLNHQQLRQVLHVVTPRGVLLLGRCDESGQEVMQAIAAKLREGHYLPISLSGKRPADCDYVETVKMLAGLSRFIIADLSGPTVPQDLYAIAAQVKIPFVPLIQVSSKSSALASALFASPWVVRPAVTFARIEELLKQLPAKVIAPAEEKHQAVLLHQGNFSTRAVPMSLQ
jgi:uncharacterized protein YjbI with pentapeptide repeats